MRKIKRNLTSSRWLVVSGWLLVVGLLIYTRFVNFGWGLPYPMHPDERNMAVAIQSLNCEFSIFPLREASNFQFSNLKECLNPHFFVYGQFPLYLGYLVIMLGRLGGFGWLGKLGEPIGFVEAVISLRIVSAIASVVTAFILLGILGRLGIFRRKSLVSRSLSLLIIIFSPGLIQFAHFGTTESLLMLFYIAIIYCSLKILKEKTLTTYYLLLTTLFSGLAIATKVSSIIFVAVPLSVLIYLRTNVFRHAVQFTVLTVFVSIFFSPHTVINFNEFIGSMQYESAVAAGRIVPFYTRQFVRSIPIFFQFIKIFPYALGWPVFLLGGLGLLGMLWRLGKKKEIDLLRFAFFVYFLPNAFLFTKWTRFMAPIFPLMLVFAVVFMQNVIRNFRFTRSLVVASLLLGMTASAIIPGISYLSVYRNSDVRFRASEWIYKNIPADSMILSETANVVDLPLGNSDYQIVSFNFYDLDQNPQLQQKLKEYIAKADYIIVPSRRIFLNHPKEQYPLLNNYYERLFSGGLGFNQVAQFDTGLADEGAEETWTVFDHPVVRIFARGKI